MKLANNKMSRVIAAALALSAMGAVGAMPAHAARTAPLVNVENEALPSGAKLAQVEAAVLQSLNNRGWTIMSRKGQTVEAQYARSGRSEFSVNITVTYSATAYSITYKDSTGLNYDPGKNQIHANYPKWIANLKLDITRMVSNAVNGVPVN